MHKREVMNNWQLDDTGLLVACARCGKQNRVIRSIPTLVVFSGGREVSRMSGARPAGDIEAFVQRASVFVQAD